MAESNTAGSTVVAKLPYPISVDEFALRVAQLEVEHGPGLFIDLQHEDHETHAVVVRPPAEGSDDE